MVKLLLIELSAILPVSTKDSRVKNTEQRKMTLKFFNFKRLLRNDHDLWLTNKLHTTDLWTLKDKDILSNFTPFGHLIKPLVETFSKKLPHQTFRELWLPWKKPFNNYFVVIFFENIVKSCIVIQFNTKKLKILKCVSLVETGRIVLAKLNGRFCPITMCASSFAPLVIVLMNLTP